MDYNIEAWKEWIILWFGPFFQTIAYYLLINLFPEKQAMIKLYHESILIFNLLPIYPLDGGKMIKILIERILPFKISLKIVIMISYSMILFLLWNHPNKLGNIWILTIVLGIIIFKEQQKTERIYYKFLLERYLHKYNYKKTKIIHNMNHFFRGKKHIIEQDKNYYLEEEYLRKKFEN